MIVGADDCLYRGKRLADMTKDELCEALLTMSRLYEEVLERHTKEREFMAVIRGKR